MPAHFVIRFMLEVSLVMASLISISLPLAWPLQPRK